MMIPLENVTDALVKRTAEWWLARVCIILRVFDERANKTGRMKRIGS